MSDENTTLGLTRGQQLLLIGAIGAVLVIVGESIPSKVTPEYNPLVFGIGVVMIAYAVVTALWDAVRS